MLFGWSSSVVKEFKLKGILLSTDEPLPGGVCLPLHHPTKLKAIFYCLDLLGRIFVD